MEAARATDRAADPDGVARIVTAARSCFARRGAAKTRMAAVAHEAGMVRQTVYTFISSRDELLELVLAQRLRELADVVIERVSVDGDLADALVEYWARITEIVREDPEFVDVSEALGTAEAFRFMTGPSAAQDAALKAIEPFYERGRKAKALREDITLELMASWTRFICAPLTARFDLGPSELRDWLRAFALPPLLNERSLPSRRRASDTFG